MAKNEKKDDRCPNCGYCPACGRAPGWHTNVLPWVWPTLPTYPVYPSYPTYPTRYWGTITVGASSDSDMLIRNGAGTANMDITAVLN